MTVLALATVLSSGLAAPACGVPSETRARRIAIEDLPYGLAGTTASSVEDLDAGQSATVTEAVNLYFAVGSSFAAKARELPSPVDLEDLVDALSEPDPGVEDLRTAVGPDDVRSIQVEGGVAIVELDPAFRGLPNAEQRIAVAQIVLTLTARPGIGQTRFQIGGDAVQVPRADGTVVRGPVSRDDFVDLITL